MIGQIQAMPVTAEQIQAITHRDSVLNQVFHYIQNRRPMKVKTSTNYFTYAKLNCL